MSTLDKVKAYTEILNVLYIEDDDDTRSSTATILKKLFNKVDLSNSIDDGLKTYSLSLLDHQEVYDVILIDIDTSTTQAIELCKKIKQDNENQIIITTSSASEYSYELVNIGIDKSLLKPIDKLEDIALTLIETAKKISQFKQFQNQKFLLEQKNQIIDKNIFMTTSDLSGVILDISNAYLEFTGYKKEEVIGQDHRIFRHHELDKDVIKNLWNTIDKDEVWSGELKNHKKSGEEYWIHVNICPLYDIHNNKIGYTAVQEDITNQNRLKELSIKDPLTLLFNKRYFDSYFKGQYKKAVWNKSPIALILLGIDFFEQYKDKYGHVEADKVILQISHKLQNSIESKIYNMFRVCETEFALVLPNKDDAYIQELSQKLLTSIENLCIENSQSSTSKYFTLSIGAVNLDTKNYHISSEDLYNITDENLTIAKNTGRNTVVMDMNSSSIHNLHNTDVITKLANREALLHDLFLLENEAMLILLHINQIKSLKDLYGFVFVSDLISKKAKELESILRSDETTLYNLNLQEFAILITDKNLFDKYLLLLEHSILANDVFNESIHNKHNITNFTAGVAYGVKNIFNHADLVLQEAIISKINYKVYAKNQSAKQLQEDTLNRLHIYKKALHNGNIIPYFQPIVDATSTEIIKYEALARLETDEGEIVTPYYFLDSAKEDKTFENFTRQMMQKAFIVFSKNNIDISLNITYENIASESMVKYMQNRLDKYGGKGITFEIVESEDILDYKVLEDFILMVKKYGCKVSIDDFGSGYSNFTNILKLNIDYIKIDGSLITKLNTDKNVKHMIKGILLYAENTDTKTIAEFVSSQELADTVRELGVDYIQGYFYGEPKSPQDYGLL